MGPSRSFLILLALAANFLEILTFPTDAKQGDVTAPSNADWINSLESDKLDDAEIESLSVDDAHAGQDLDEELAQISKKNVKQEFDERFSEQKDPSTSGGQGGQNTEKSIEQINAENIEEIPVKIKDGDIAVDPNEPTSSPNDDLSKRASLRNLKMLWTDKVIPYVLDSSLSAAGRNGIFAAIAEYENKTCLRFTNDTTNKTNWITFKRLSGCWSYVGRLYWRSGSQTISIGNGCSGRGTVIHEIMHAMGFKHEQSRPDRDRYIEVFWENIQKGKEGNFGKASRRYYQLHGTTYDYDGIMQYGKTAFGGGKVTLQAIGDPSRSLGQRNGFTNLDLQEINALYHCKKSSGGFSEWASWTPCLESGAKLFKERQRYCYDANATKCPGADSYGIIKETKTLTCADCKLDGHWGPWTSFGDCSANCSYGTKSRSRVCNDPKPRCGGAYCNGSSYNTLSCYEGRCNAGPDDCDFDKKRSRLCNWSNKGAVNFTINTGTTPSSGTGPTTDTTIGAGYYLYLEGSYYRGNEGKEALFRSRTMPVVKDRVITFRYHMNGGAITYLKLVLENTKGTTVLFQKSGSQGNEWKNASITYSSNTSYTLTFQSKMGTWWQNDPAIDDITFVEPTVDRCLPNPCLNNGTCANQPGGHKCTCPIDFTGTNCETAVDRCLPNPCLNNGTCAHQPGGHKCTCPIDFTGPNCETAVDRCLPNPCFNGGTCANQPGGHKCTCPIDFTGPNCETAVDRCLPNPCFNGGTCANQPGGHKCTCPIDFTGKNCKTAVDRCLPNPCFNGGTCANQPGGHKCTCPIDFTGKNCETAVDRCLPNPCFNGGTCANQPGGHKCTCPIDFTGKNCETAVDRCLPNPCFNGGTCANQPGGHKCTCPIDFTGKNCETAVDRCLPNPCFNGGTCANQPGGHKCTCPIDFTGKNCETAVDRCLPNPCFNGGTCANQPGGHKCTCPIDFTGKNCETAVDRCLPNPCFNGGTCANQPGGHKCTCPINFTGKNCERAVDHCSLVHCQNGGTCTSLAGGYRCTCVAPYTGKNCETILDKCAQLPCKNGGTCSYIKGGYVCSCTANYTGKHCENAVDSCSPNPCLNGGSCSSSAGSYVCYCPSGFTGKNCETAVVNKCSPNPCLNGGSCSSSAGSYVCYCPSGFTGKNCGTAVVNKCSPNPCLNGGSCSSSAGSYVCYCPSGFTGKNCDTAVVNKCSPNPCLNGGSCSSSAGSYVCYCPSGFTGKNCETAVVNKCSPNPCLNGGSCSSSAGSYVCYCPSGFTGKNCETAVVNKCSPNPCLNGGSCSSSAGSYVCYCPSGFTGKNCETAVTSKFVDLVSCDFECGFCSLKQHQGDKLDWVRRSRGTPSFFTGPSYDHTTRKDGFYAYTEVTGERNGANAVLHSPEMQSDGKTRCLDFYYHMKGNGMGSFKVEIEVDGAKTGLLTKNGHQGDKWQHGQATISVANGKKFKVLFESIRGNSYRGDVAIDDITLWEGQCPSPPENSPSVLHCLFERGFCKWTPVSQNSGYWTDGRSYVVGKRDEVDNEATEMNSGVQFDKRGRPRRGPRRALSGPQDDFAKYKGLTSGQSTGTLSSAKFSSSGPICMRFFAHMYGREIGQLSVKETTSGAELLTLIGSQGRRWFDNAVEVPAGQNSMIKIEAKQNRKAVIAIDDIAVSSGKCAPTKELYKCDFSSGSCGLKQDHQDTCDWKIVNSKSGKALQWNINDCQRHFRNEAFLLKELRLPKRGGCLTIDYHLGYRDICPFFVTLFDASDLGTRKRSYSSRRIYYKKVYSRWGKVQQIHVTVPPARRGCPLYELEFATKLRRYGRKCRQVNIDKIVFKDAICGN